MPRILIVEDEISNQEVAEIICKGAGYDVAIARNGREAIDVLESGDKFDLVLMDVLMPVMDGITATRLLRADSRFACLPILGMTAKASQADAKEMLAAGMNGIITKPFRNKALLLAIGEMLASRASREPPSG